MWTLESSAHPHDRYTFPEPQWAADMFNYLLADSGLLDAGACPVTVELISGMAVGVLCTVEIEHTIDGKRAYVAVRYQAGE